MRLLCLGEGNGQKMKAQRLRNHLIPYQIPLEFNIWALKKNAELQNLVFHAFLFERPIWVSQENRLEFEKKKKKNQE